MAPEDEFVDVSFDELEVKRRQAKIIHREEVEQGVFAFTLEVDSAMRFYPGQYILVDYHIDGKRVVRAYTMTSTPSREDQFELCIQKTEDATTSDIIASKSMGDEISIRGPFGRFVLRENIDKILLVAVNIGINPFISMLRWIEEEKLSTDVTLLYQWEWGQIPLFQQELDRVSKSINLKVLMTGNVGESIIGIEQDMDKVYICGERRVTNPLMEKIKGSNLFDEGKILLEQWF